MFSNLIKSSSYKGLQSTSIRKYHWFWNADYGGATKDDLDMEKMKKETGWREFGQEEIDDKDRNPHLYWNIFKGRGVIQRLVPEPGFSKDWKVDFLRSQAEKTDRFTKLDSLDFLEHERRAYNYLTDNARNSIGYNSEEEDENGGDELLSHNDYGKLYNETSDKYKEMVLYDPCDSRPVYEWQVPYGLDDAYGYKEISTAVDILGNNYSNNNLTCSWKVSNNFISDNNNNNNNNDNNNNNNNNYNFITLTNSNTSQQMVICQEKDIQENIKKWSPDAVVIDHGAERLLASFQHTMSPRSPIDAKGCRVALLWSAFIGWFFSPLHPILTLGAIVGINAPLYLRTYFDKNDLILKRIMKECREKQCNVVFGGWLSDDYDERINWVSGFDDVAQKVHDQTLNTKQSILSQAKNTIDTELKKFNNKNKQRNKLTMNDILSSNWIKSYRDAVNNRKIDLFAQVSNNVQGNKILVGVHDIDNIPADVVLNLLMQRLTGNIALNKPILKFDDQYERVSVDF